MVSAALAVCTGPARVGGFHGHRHAGLEAAYCGSDSVHSGRGFVAHDQALRSRDVLAVNAAMVPEVHIAATDADVCDAHYDVVGVYGFGEDRNRVVFNFGIARSVKEYRGVLNRHLEYVGEAGIRRLTCIVAELILTMVMRQMWSQSRSERHTIGSYCEHCSTGRLVVAGGSMFRQ